MTREVRGEGGTWRKKENCQSRALKRTRQREMHVDWRARTTPVINRAAAHTRKPQRPSDSARSARSRRDQQRTFVGPYSPCMLLSSTAPH